MKDELELLIDEWLWSNKSTPSLAVAVRAWISSKLPEVEKAHTYASENADVYRAFDEGQKYMRDRLAKSLGVEGGKTKGEQVGLTQGGAE